MDAKDRNLLVFFIVILGLHLPTTIYAYVDEGSLAFGATAPERFLIHALSNDETHISISGARKHIINDLCIQKCFDCPMDCYETTKLIIDCTQNECKLKTVRGTIILNENQTLSLVLKGGFNLEGTTFRCYGTECGFDEDLGEKILSHHMPEGIKLIV